MTSVRQVLLLQCQPLPLPRAQNRRRANLTALKRWISLKDKQPKAPKLLSCITAVPTAVVTSLPLLCLFIVQNATHKTIARTAASALLEEVDAASLEFN